MAISEGSGWVLEDAAVVIVAVEICLRRGAGSTDQASALGFTTGFVIPCRLPAISENNIRPHQLALAGSELILSIAVEVSTEATGGILVIVRHFDRDITVAIIGYQQAKISAHNHGKP